MKKFYDLFLQVIESRRFSRVVRKLSYYRNPAERELFDEIRTKTTIKTNQNLKSKTSQLEQIKNSYEYKIFEHSKMVEFYNQKRDASEFVKYLDSSLFENKKMWTKSMWFVRPFFIHEDYERSFTFKLLLGLGIIVAFKFGFFNGFKDSTLLDTDKELVINIKTEEQLFDILINKNKPILVLYYWPALPLALEMAMYQGRFIEEYGNNQIEMAKVNCRYNMDLCVKKINFLNMPQYEIMFPPIKEPDEEGRLIKRIPIYPCCNERSYEGLIGYLMNFNLIPNKFDPMYVVAKAMSKYD